MQVKLIVGDISEAVVRGNNISVFSVQTGEVYRRDYSRIERLFDTLTRCGKAANLKIVLIFAFDDDVREIYEIPEIREYLVEMLRMAPHMFYWIVPQDALFLTLSGAVVASTNSVTRRAYMVVDSIKYINSVNAVSTALESYAKTLCDYNGADRAKRELRPLVSRFQGRR